MLDNKEFYISSVVYSFHNLSLMEEQCETLLKISRKKAPHKDIDFLTPSINTLFRQMPNPSIDKFEGVSKLVENAKNNLYVKGLDMIKAHGIIKSGAFDLEFSPIKFTTYDFSGDITFPDFYVKVCAFTVYAMGHCVEMGDFDVANLAEYHYEHKWRDKIFEYVYSDDMNVRTLGTLGVNLLSQKFDTYIPE